MTNPPDTPDCGRPLRVLFVLEFFHPHVGGAETLFNHLAVALAQKGHQVSVVTLWIPGTARRETWNGVDIIRIPTPRWANRYFFTLLAIPEVQRRARDADLIHTTTYNAVLPAWLATVRRRKPGVLTVHEVFAEQWHRLPGLNPLLGYGFRLFEWFVLRLPFRHYVCDSDFTRQRLIERRHLAPSRVSVVYPSVDYAFWGPRRHSARPLREELGLARDTFLYLYFGRPGLSKGVEYLLEAVPRVRAELPGSRLVLLLAHDPAAQYRKVRAHILRAGLADHAIVLDPVPRGQLPSYLLAADCVVVPSISEGFGYAAAEAAALGCRVVATSGHSVQEILAGHVLLVPPRDPAALADAVIGVARKPPRMALPPERFSIAAHVDGMLAAYAEILRHSFG